MRNKITITSLLLLGAIFAAGCSGAMPTTEGSPSAAAEVESTSVESHDAEMDSADMDESMNDPMNEESEMDSSEMTDASMDTPAWFDIPLTNVNTGETFTINALKGNVVLVETLAMWCSNCLKQQKEVAELHTLLGKQDGFISLGLDIDPNEQADDLKAYTAKNGFTWEYAIAPAEVTRDLGNLYDAQFLNPPSTPMLIIDRNGQVHPLPFGIKSAKKLFEELEPILGESS